MPYTRKTKLEGCLCAMLLPLISFWSQVSFQSSLSRVLLALPGRSWRWTRQTGWCRQTRRRQPEGACRKAWTFCRNLKKIMSYHFEGVKLGKDNNGGSEVDQLWFWGTEVMTKITNRRFKSRVFFKLTGHFGLSSSFFARCVIRALFSPISQLVIAMGLNPRSLGQGTAMLKLQCNYHVIHRFHSIYNPWSRLVSLINFDWKVAKRAAPKTLLT